MLWNDGDDERVANMDPLGADVIVSTIPQLNAAKDTDRIAGELAALCKKACFHNRTYYEVLAIVRDLGLLAGSLRRHGRDPMLLVPELESIFLEAGELTNLVPRDTLMHYTTWNPSGDRMRRYTGHEEEPDLIQSIKMSFPAIRDATRHLFEMRDFALHEKRTLHIVYQISFALRRFLVGLHHAIRNVHAEVFIHEFRPFFEPFSVGSKQFRGPGAVTMPLHIFDFLFWGTSELDARYQRFTLDYLPYNTSEMRQYYLRSRNTPSLLDRIENAVSNPHEAQELKDLLPPVAVCMKRIRGFREAHLKYAVHAYHGSGHHNFKSGSGGHTTSDLEWLANLTRKHESRLADLRKYLAMVLPPLVDERFGGESRPIVGRDANV
jgi:hypothetical protein